MAGFFNAVQEAIADNQHVICPRFVRFDFDSGEVRLWEGFKDIIIDGETWTGASEIGSISDATIGNADVAGNITYELSGVSAAVVAAALDQYDEVRGRTATLYGHFMDAETLQPLDDFFLLRQDLMDTMSFEGAGPTNRKVSLTCETIWTARNNAAFAYFSDRDQQARFANDVGLERMPLYSNGVRRRWPTF